jgi:dienelactone hydrolase
MSGEQLTKPLRGTAADVPYVALPPTAIDAAPAGPLRLIVAWHGFDPPCTEAAFAAAVPMTGVPAWRVFLGLRPPGGGPPEVRDQVFLDLFGPAVEHAADRLPVVLAELRRELSIEEGPVGLVGFSVGGAAALLSLATGVTPVFGAALISPVVAPTRALAALERRSGRTYQWTARNRAIADRLDFGARAGEIARRDPALLLVGGTDDEIVTAADVTGLRDLLVARGLTDVEAVTLRMTHALAAEPGMDPEPPTAEAVGVDHALTDWFRDRLAAAPPSGSSPASPLQTVPLTAIVPPNRPVGRHASRPPSPPGSATPRGRTAVWTEMPSLGSYPAF